MSIPLFGVDPLDFHNEDEFWAAVDEERSASLGPDPREMGYDDLSHEYDDEDAGKTEYRVHCSVHGAVNIGYVNYMHQLHRPDDLWKCHICNRDAEWIGIFEPCSQCGEIVDYDNDDKCPHCGKVFYEEPKLTSEEIEDFETDEETQDRRRLQFDDDIPF